MKRLRLLRWSGSVLSPRTRPWCQSQFLFSPSRSQSTALVQPAVDDQAPLSPIADPANSVEKEPGPPREPITDYTSFPSPPPERALSSAKLAALHARLQLSSRLPLQTLARCLVDCSADQNFRFNNSRLAVIGNDLLSYYTSEVIITRYPRLPQLVIYACMSAYIGQANLVKMTAEWGVEHTAIPGGEVDPGVLQFKRLVAGNADLDGTGELYKSNHGSKDQGILWNRGRASLAIGDSPFGERTLRDRYSPVDYAERPELLAEDHVTEHEGISIQVASSTFVHAVMGAVYLHGGRAAAKAFFREHFLSRELDVSKLMKFTQPTRDLSRLCAREGFESPVARIISETGRFSRTPVFVVGVFSGRDKLGEGQGGSLDEARIKAAVNALKGWYLYSPLETMVPSDAEGSGKEWKPCLVDGGEVIV